MPKNIILNSLKESFSVIWKNKALFVLLFVLQVIFFAVFSSINVAYQTKILENMKSITTYLSQQKLDESSVTSNILQRKNILGDDPLSISRNFNEILLNFRIYIVYVFALLIFFLSMAWSMAHMLMHKNNFKQLAKTFFKSLLVLSFYLGLIFSFFLSLLNIIFTQIASESAKLFTKYIPFLIFSIILVYFMFISLALIIKTELRNIVQRTLSIGIRKMHYISAVYVICIILFGIPIVLLYYFLEQNMFIVMLSLILIVFSFVFGRILMANVVEKLEN